MTVGPIPVIPPPTTVAPMNKSGRIVLAMVLAVLVAVATAAVALGASSRPDPAPRPALPAEPLSLVVGGIPAMLAPGQTIPLAADLNASLRFVREIGTTRRLEITLARADGTVPTDTTIRVAAHMRYMDHGSFDAVAVPDGAGRFVAALPFAMPGEWEARVEIASGGAPAALTFDVDLTR